MRRAEGSEGVAASRPEGHGGVARSRRRAGRRAAELTHKTQTDVAAWIERERVAAALADARVKHATAQQYRDADEKLSETKEFARVKKKAGEMERAHRDGEEIRRRLSEELRRLRETAKVTHASWQTTAGQLEDTRRLLEREQENSIRMHQERDQKLACSGAAAGGSSRS